MISTILMTIAAAAPVLILTNLILRRSADEPRKWLIGSAIAGVLAAMLATAAVTLTLPDFEVESFGGTLVDAFCRAAIPEECFKLLLLVIVAKCCESFNEIFDGITYAVCLAMGFAFFENVTYLITSDNGWFFTGVLRALVSVPAHYFFAIIMGAFFSLAWFDTRNRTLNSFLALTLPVCAHGIFDALFLESPIVEYGSAVLIVVFVLFFKKLRLYASTLVSRRLSMELN